MSDVPPRPRIRPATSDDWQKDPSDRASLTPPQGQESPQSAADFDSSTYYEYLEKHTGDTPVPKTQSRNHFTHGGEHEIGWSSPPAQTDNSAGGPPSGQILQQSAPTSKKGNGTKIIVVIIAIIMILALLAYFGVRWLAPSTGTVPVDFGGDESASAPSSPEETQVASPTSPEEALSRYTQDGTSKASDLEGQWVTQVSAKDVGLKADGKTWSAQDIVDEFEANRIKYPGAILIYSGDWDSYKDDNYWVTVIDTPYSNPEPALDQCRSWGLDRDHCLAKRLVKDGSPTDNSAYLDR